MLKLVKYQQYVLGVLASIVLFLIAAAIMAISLFSANRHQAAGINAIFAPNSPTDSQ